MIRSGQKLRWLQVAAGALVLTMALMASSGLASLAQATSSSRNPSERAVPPSLTDVAPPPPVVEMRPEEGPEQRLRGLGLQVRAGNLPAPAKLPEDMVRPEAPPLWTEVLAEPDEELAPPDPFSPPPMAVNPERVRPEKPGKETAPAERGGGR